MTVGAMSDTRRRGDSKRLDSLYSLVKEAADPGTLSICKKAEMIGRAVSNATGLNTDQSIRNFRCECELVLHSSVAPYFHLIWELSERIWKEKKVVIHSKYHIVIKISMLVRGKRYTPGISLSAIERYYSTYGTLP
jgi:hypothetical protein